MSREAFIADITREVPETPVYFLHSRDLNREGPPLRDGAGLPPVLAPAEAKAALADGAVLLDTRPLEMYSAAHPLGALHVGLDGQYASWVGTFLRPDEAMLVLAPADRREESAMRLARVGYERVVGLLEPEPARWADVGLATRSIAVEPIAESTRAGRRVLDVRRRHEWQSGHLPGATHIPLAELPARVAELDRDAEWMVVCAGGYRSAIGVSVLERAGFTKLVMGEGGMDVWQREQRPVLTGA